jgi:glycosyltransferase involved in cell wall biosynthesis
MKVTIITASYNSLDTIKDTLTSVLKQTYTDIEYIVVEGCSTDGTLEYIHTKEKELNLKLNSFKIISEKDQGIADAWNKGLKLATGEIIFFLNSDDWIHKNTVEKAVKLMNLNKLELVYGVCNRVSESKAPLGSFQKKFNKFRIIWNFGFSFTTCFCSKKVYDKIGGFNLNYKIAIDSDFLLRCVKNNIKFIKSSHITYMRIGGISTKNRLAAHKEYKKALIENGYPNFLVNLSYFFFKFT